MNTNVATTSKPASLPQSRIVIRTHPNQERRTYATNFPVSEYSIHAFSLPLRPRDAKDLAEVGESGAGIVRKLAQVIGVTVVFITPYEITVGKSAATAWGEIEDAIVGIIAASLSAHLQESVGVGYVDGCVPKDQRTINATFTTLDDHTVIR